MKPSRIRALFALLLCLTMMMDAEARHRHHHPRNQDGGAVTPGISADFDYYLLALSWSPAFCNSPAGHKPEKQTQCDQPLGFVVHGLWPQNKRGYPHDCGAPGHVPAEIAAPVLNAELPMPPGDPELIDHEWSKHGTCSGLDMPGYFKAIKTATSRLKIPEELKSPEQPLQKDFQAISAAFRTANPGLSGDMLDVIADRSGNISEIYVCFDKRLEFQRCLGRHRTAGGRFLPVR